MTDAEALEIQTFPGPGFGENAYLVRCGGSAWVAVDPGGGAEAMADAIERAGARLEAVLLTHAHMDHIEGIATLVRRHPAPILMHPADAPLYERVTEQAEFFGLTVEPPPPVDRALADGETLRFGGCTFDVRHVPGHSPGHVLFHCEAAGAAFVGDVIFQGSIGRTDLPGGDYRRLMRSIRERVLTLPDETVLYPGHGPPTTVAHERVSNPFLVAQYGGGLA